MNKQIIDPTLQTKTSYDTYRYLADILQYILGVVLHKLSEVLEGFKSVGECVDSLYLFVRETLEVINRYLAARSFYAPTV